MAHSTPFATAVGVGVGTAAGAIAGGVCELCGVPNEKAQNVKRVTRKVCGFAASATTNVALADPIGLGITTATGGMILR